MGSEFEGLVAVVTGGASGIGAAVADRLADSGAAVAVFDIDVTGASTRHAAIQTDIGDDNSVRTAIEEVFERFGHIDILVNNAGIGAQGDVSANDDAEWHSVWDVNVVGMARVTRAALPHLRRSRAASVVNMASIAALVGLPERVLYSATKGAVLAMTKAMAADHLVEGIRVNAVNPGTAATPWVERLLAKAADPKAERRALEARQPHGRLVSPAEIADVVAYLASPVSRSTTGISIAVDGGLSELRLPAK